MIGGDDALKALREALQLSPDNLPLRPHLADTLLGLGRADEAEQEYRAGLRLAPDDGQLRLGLATAFEQQGQYGQALVVVEELARGPSAPPRACLLHARLLLRVGDAPRAVLQYRRATELDPSLADPELAARLGIRPGLAGGRLSSAPSDPFAVDPPTVDPPAADPFVVEGREREARDPDALAAPDSELERPTISFADVGGMEALKEEIKIKVVHPLAHPELYRAYGKSIGGGILMYGPPGCGKTYLARATAGEISAAFLSVGIQDVLDMWIGNSERNLHELFQRARRNRPCVLFFDEVDALGASRADMRRSGGRQLINQFLSEMDGVAASNEGVLILAATNAPWHLDSAFRRPGRFDRVLFVPPPDAFARAAVLRVPLRGKPLRDVDFDHLAKKTDSFSGADLKAVVDLAVEEKLRQAIKAGVPTPLVTKDLLAAAGSVKPSTKEWFATARNYAVYSNEGGVYDDVVKYLKL